jgi:predicted MFS family arabinose efflux permease
MPPPSHGRGEAASPETVRSTRIIFLILGLVAAAWAPLVPDLKLRLALDDAELGLMLLAIGAGSLLAAPLTGLLVARHGGRRVMLVLGTIFCATLPALTILPGIPLTATALFLFGATLAGIDVAMNIQAVAVERACARPMMSGFHGLFSVGGLLGASLVSALLYFNATPLAATLIIAAAALALLLSQSQALLPRADSPATGLSLPRGRLALIGALCFIAFMAEGAVHDWTAVLLRFHRDAGPATAGLAYAAFATAMTIGRLTGDAVLNRLPHVHVLAWGAALAAAGFLTMTAIPTIPAALIGCALIGIGEANIVPALFSAAARTKGTDPSLAIAAVASPGYIGLLAGPPLIGLAAQATTLPIALGTAGLLLLLITATARTATRETPA